MTYFSQNKLKFIIFLQFKTEWDRPIAFLFLFVPAHFFLNAYSRQCFLSRENYNLVISKITQ